MNISVESLSKYNFHVKFLPVSQYTSIMTSRDGSIYTVGDKIEGSPEPVDCHKLTNPLLIPTRCTWLNSQHSHFTSGKSKSIMKLWSPPGKSARQFRSKSGLCQSTYAPKTLFFMESAQTTISFGQSVTTIGSALTMTLELLEHSPLLITTV